MDDSYIQSRQNNQIKNLVKLRERKHRDRQKLFIVEGLREIEHAIKADYKIETIYFCPDFFSPDTHSAFIDHLRRCGKYSLVRLSKGAFVKASMREGPDGIIGIGYQQSHSLDELSSNKNSLILVLEGIEKPGNLGAILRSADGAGADAVILVDCVLDIYNPNAIRTSQGLVFALPVVCAQKKELTAWIAKHSIQVIATSPDTETCHWSVNYTKPTAIIIGSESLGLSEYWLQSAHQCIRIPMAGSADSLNVAAAAAVCLYEVSRQRHTS